MFKKYLILGIVLSVSLFAKGKINRTETADENKILKSEENVSLSGNFNDYNAKKIADYVLKKLTTDKKIKKIKKENKIDRMTIKFGSFRNKTSQHISMMILKSLIQKRVIRSRAFRVLSSRAVQLKQEKIKQSKESGVNSLGHEIETDFILSGTMEDIKIEVKGDFKIVSYIFKYNLTDDKNNIVYEDNVTVKNKVKIRIPEWFKMEAGVYSINKNRLFLAIGMSEPLKNREETVENSIKNSKRNLVAVLNKYLQELYNIYDKNKKNDGISKKKLEKNIVNVLKLAVKEKFKIAEIKAGWTNPKDNKNYNLIVLRFEDFQKLVTEANGFDKNFVTKFKKYSEQAFDKLKKTVNKPENKKKPEKTSETSKPRIEVLNMDDERPAWVMKGAGTFIVEGRKVFRAVGLSANTGNELEAMNYSADDARKILTFVIHVYIKALKDSYKKTLEFEKDIELVKKVMSKSKFHNTLIADRWIHPEVNTIYTLLELDLNAFQKTIRSIKGLSGKFIKTFNERSLKAYKEVNERLKKAGDF